MKRQYSPDQPELLDLPQPLTPELERDLANLASLNRHFGSHQIIRRFLRRWLVEKRPVRILDLATGYGDIPRLIVEWAAARGITVEADAVDANQATVDIARSQSRHLPGISWICADALSFEGARTYDLVCCSLALHHFSEADAITLLRRVRRLSHQYALVVDLERSPLTTGGIWLLTTFIYRDHMTKFDGMLSARRAFSFSEVNAMAEQAGWEHFGHDRCFPCRQALWLEMRTAGEIPVTALEEPVTLPCPT